MNASSRSLEENILGYNYIKHNAVCNSVSKYSKIDSYNILKSFFIFWAFLRSFLGYFKVIFRTFLGYFNVIFLGFLGN